ncbi:probable thiopurine S-methyltransferase [Ptychodera flava]|uniref:probable thiopurine S-methyltransferase n=1 Tax=Ptychodera flava TaxID=63121 RepID=UPI00396A15FB
MSKSSSGDQENYLTEEKWKNAWQMGDIGFHLSEVNSTLLKHFSKLVAGRSDLNVFLPLCGKSLDLKWIADQGHRAVGVEFSELAIKSFFSEHKIEYSSTPMEGVPNGTVYTSKDGKIKLFQCDFYLFTEMHAGKFDIMWDRGSLVAINPSDRTRYVDKMTSLLKPDGSYLLSSLNFNEDAFKGPPFPIPLEVVKSLFGNACNVDFLEENDIKAIDEELGPKTKYMFEQVILLTFK